MKKILVTGATGFVGGFLVPRLEKNYQVKLFKRNDNIDQLMAGVDIVIHLAGKAHDRGAVSEDFRLGNIQLTQDLVQSAKKHGVKRFIFTSTSKVYGEVSFAPWNEESPLLSETDYGKSKIVCEKMLLDSGLDYVIFRPPLILGGGGRGNLGLLEKAIKLNLPLPSNIKNRRSFVDVDYFVKAVIFSIESAEVSKRIFNVANRIMSTTELFQSFGHKVFVPYPSLFLNSMPEYYKTKLVSDYELDTKKFNSIFSDTNL